MAPDFDPYQQWLDIAPHEHPVDHYRLLGVTRFEADPEVIRRAAEARMAHIHSFQTGPRGTETQPLLNALAAAKLCLLDADSKSSYDQWLRGQFGVVPPVQTPAVSPPQPPLNAGPPPPPPPAAAAPLVTADIASVTPRRAVMRRRKRGNFTAIGLVALAIFAAVAFCGALLLYWLDPSRQQSLPAAAGPREAPPRTASDNTADQVVVQQEGNGQINLTPATAVLAEPCRRERSAEVEILSGWTAPTATASWSFQAVRQGAYRALITYRVAAGGRFELRLDDDTPRTLATRRAASPGQTITDETIVVLRRAGRHRLQLRATERLDEGIFVVERVTLVPLVQADSAQASRPEDRFLSLVAAVPPVRTD